MIMDLEDDVMKEKLISFPKIILDKLDEYKTKTGINSTDYIRHALVRQMVLDKLIYFTTEYIKTKEIKK